MQHLIAITNLIGGHHFVAHFGDHLAIHGDGTRGNEHVRLATRADAGISDVFVQPDRTVLFLVFQRQDTLFARQSTTFATTTFDDFAQDLGLGHYIAATRLGIVIFLAESALERAVTTFIASVVVAITVKFAIAPTSTLIIVITVKFAVTSASTLFVAIAVTVTTSIPSELAFPVIVVGIAFFGEFRTKILL